MIGVCIWNRLVRYLVFEGLGFGVIEVMGI